MKCPKCDKEFDIPEVVYRNCATYDKINLIVSNCCNTPFLVSPKVTFRVTEYIGNQKEDDWGNPIRIKFT